MSPGTGGQVLVVKVEQRGEVFDFPVTVTIEYADRPAADIIVNVTDRVVERRLVPAGRVRAVAVNPDASRLMGVRVGWMLALGWGLAAVLGAVAGMMAAPTVFLDPDMMLVVLIYAFAAAVLGGIDSPVGAVVGGLVLGVVINLLGRYVNFVGQELRLPSALALLLLVLLVRPAGLFGRVAVRRV
jgi:branched-chain amino acid transport system permease protein